ncbi:MAG: DNA repair protein RecN [Gemmatimonadaceae bacterium]|nr:DNA repair protein RecN [Gemmatimonadaceae bacterium]
MLVELRIRNLAVFEDAALAPATGMTVLTGETGAGKSLVVGAVLLLLGERGGSDRVRSGAERASVEGRFDMHDAAEWSEWLDARGIAHELPHDRTLILRREVAVGGRSRAWINGSAVTTAVLGEAGQRLVTVYGQHEAQALADERRQRDALDAFGDARTLAAEVRTAYHVWRDAVEHMQALERAQADAARRADYLRFVAREIDEARLVEGEPERLEEELRRLSHAEELRSLASEAMARLDGDDDGSVHHMLALVRRGLHQLTRIDATAARFEGLLDQAETPLAELERELSAYAEAIDLDPERLHAVEARRDVVQGVLRKHGPSVAEALRVRDEARSTLALVDEGDTARRAAADAAHVAHDRLRTQSALLTAARSRAGERLARDVTALLPELGIPDGVLQVHLVPLDAQSADGAERIEWRVQLNAGDVPRPLGRVASGGELARVMLAVATVLAQVNAVPTIVFDEIDAGIGGAIAVHVGAAMQRLAAHRQVLAVTHLAQIAACADTHGVVTKSSDGQRTTAALHVVIADDRIGELARMLGGDATRTVAREHAALLLANATTREPDVATPAHAAARSPKGAPRRTRG